MLKGIDPLLSPELLHVLASMGHGDEIAFVDSNFPSVSHTNRLVRLDGADLLTTVCSVLTVLPIDTFIASPVGGMQMVETPSIIPDVQRDVFAAVDAAEGRSVGVERIERFAFYERVRNAFAVVATTELRPYGCVIFTKGVVF
jgi:L-fucose mutarotase